MRIVAILTLAGLSVAACSFSSTTVQRPTPAPVVSTAPASQTTTTTTSIGLTGD